MAEDIIEIKVFGNDDESLRILGQLLSSETSRKIILLLTQEEMYTNQISKRLRIQMNTTVFHLKKLVDVGLVIVTHKQIVKRGVDHKYYKMIPNIFVNTTQSKKEVHENGFLKRIFKEGVKICSVFLVAVMGMSIFSKNDITKPIEIINDNESIIPDMDIVLIPIQNVSEFQYEWIIIPISVVIISSIIFIFLKKRKKSRIID